MSHPGDRREPPADTKCLPAAQRKQAKRACLYICNELIEETGGHRKLIFGMWESFGYGSSKF